MNCCVIFCFKDGRENEAAIMKLYTLELSMLKQNHKTLDPSIFVVSNIFGTEYIVEILCRNIKKKLSKILFQKIETSLLNNEYLKKFLFTTVNTK